MTTNKRLQNPNLISPNDNIYSATRNPSTTLIYWQAKPIDDQAHMAQDQQGSHDPSDAA